MGGNEEFSSNYIKSPKPLIRECVDCKLDRSFRGGFLDIWGGFVHNKR
jgi:hypothetical protein